MEGEPHPRAEGADYWAETSPQWLERYEYIEARSETYLENFRDDSRYDFSRMDDEVRLSKSELLTAYEKFARGEFTVARVKDYVILLRDSFKRLIQAPRENVPASQQPRNYARENWQRNKKQSRAGVDQNESPGYAKVWHYDESLKMREQSAKMALYNREQNRRIITDGFKPIPGKTCVTLSGGFAFDSSGRRISEQKALRLISEELRAEILEQPFPGRIDDSDLWIKTERQAPEEKTDDKETGDNKPQGIQTKGKNLDELKKAIYEENLNRRLRK